MMVAVGMPVTWHPPHRSQGAVLTHWAPLLGVWRQNDLVGNSGTEGLAFHSPSQCSMTADTVLPKGGERFFRPFPVQ